MIRLLAWFTGPVGSFLMKYVLPGVLLAVAAYFLIYRPIYEHGYDEGHRDGVSTLAKRVAELEQTISDKDAATADAIRVVNENAIQAVRRANAEKDATAKRLSAALSEYGKAREEALAQLVNGRMRPDGEQYYAPIDTAGLSKPGVDAVNRMIDDGVVK